MTNREKTIKGIRQTWLDATLRKEELIKEIWKQETIINNSLEKLCKYGEEDFNRVAEQTTDLG